MSHVYPPGDRPEVEVLVDGSWNRLDTFHEDDVRQDTVDRSYGRGG